MNLGSLGNNQNPISNTTQNLNNSNNNTSNQPQNTNINRNFPQPTNNTTQNQPQINSNPPPNPFGGINIMDIFSQINQTGGVGQIMSMSLGDMLD
jgi:hypothetical protein